MTDAHQPADLDRTATIVAAYLAHNTVRADELPGVICAVHAALAGLGAPTPVEASAAAPSPAVSVRKSVTHDHIVSLEDGRKLKSLKRHLGALGMTPDQYRAKWGLPADYPMVAPAYAARRSELARAAGLGRPKRLAG